MVNPYIPAPDAAFDAMFANFSALITASPTTYGLVSGDATAIAAAFTSWHAAYLLATNPGTRTAVTIAAKDAERTNAEQVMRPYAQQVARNPAVTNGDKTDLGLNLPNNTRPPIPPPLTQPGLFLVSASHFLTTLGYKDTSTPTSKAKPVGAIGMELWRAIGTTPTSDPSIASFFAIVTKSPTPVGHDAGDVGKVATFFARWTTRSGPTGVAQPGPWSAPFSTTLI